MRDAEQPQSTIGFHARAMLESGNDAQRKFHGVMLARAVDRARRLQNARKLLNDIHKACNP